VLADIKILVIVLSQSDLLLVVSKLQVRHIVLWLNGRIVDTPSLLFLFSLLLVLFQLLW